MEKANLKIPPTGADVSYLLEVLTEERKLIASAILERNRQSTQIKQWCTTLWLAAWGIMSFDHIWESLLGRGILISAAPVVFPIFFFGMELANKRLERKFSFRGRQIHRFLNGVEPYSRDGKSTFSRFLECGDLGHFCIYDPAAMSWFRAVDPPHTGERKEFENWISFRSLLSGSWGLTPFYIGLMVASLVGTGLLFFATRASHGVIF